VVHFRPEYLVHFTPVQVVHIAPESLVHFAPVEVVHYTPVCSKGMEPIMGSRQNQLSTPRKFIKLWVKNSVQYRSLLHRMIMPHSCTVVPKFLGRSLFCLYLQGFMYEVRKKVWSCVGVDRNVTRLIARESSVSVYTPHRRSANTPQHAGRRVVRSTYRGVLGDRIDACFALLVAPTGR